MLPDGRMILIVGPSGSGKDTLIRGLKSAMGGDKRFLFVQRVVTRPVDTGSEDHASMSKVEFQEAEAAGVFAVTWEAHGLLYAIPAKAIEHIAKGGIAIANGSRRALKNICAIFPEAIIVNVTVRRDVLRQRLVARGRECDKDIEARLDRAEITLPVTTNVIEIDNSGSLEQAMDALEAAVLNCSNDNIDLLFPQA